MYILCKVCEWEREKERRILIQLEFCRQICLPIAKIVSFERDKHFGNKKMYIKKLSFSNERWGENATYLPTYAFIQTVGKHNSDIRMNMHTMWDTKC